MTVARLRRICGAFFTAQVLLLSPLVGFLWLLFAQGAQENLLKMTFDAKDYEATTRLASDMLRRQPNNPYAHYYLGYSLVRTGKIGAGRYELTKSQALSRGTSFGKLADQALDEILPYEVKSDKFRVEPKMTDSSSKERQRLLDEQEKEMDAVQKRFDAKVSQLQKTCSLAELKSATQQEFTTLSKEQEAITARYQRRADALLRRGSLPTLPPLGQSNASFGTVRNYSPSYDPSSAVNIPSENPMHASALKLGATSKKGIAPTTAKSTKVGGK